MFQRFVRAVLIMAAAALFVACSSSDDSSTPSGKSNWNEMKWNNDNWS